MEENASKPEYLFTFIHNNFLFIIKSFHFFHLVIYHQVRGVNIADLAIHQVQFRKVKANIFRVLWELSQT